VTLFLVSSKHNTSVRSVGPVLTLKVQRDLTGRAYRSCDYTVISARLSRSGHIRNTGLYVPKLRIYPQLWGYNMQQEGKKLSFIYAHPTASSLSRSVSEFPFNCPSHPLHHNVCHVIPHCSFIACWCHYDSCSHHVRFQVLMAANMKMTDFWDVAPCSLVEICRRFRGPYYFFIALNIKAIRTSETSVNLHQTTRRNNPKDGHSILINFVG
jgi:hypothetical protein